MWFRALVESAPDAMVIVNKAGTILLANRQAENMFLYGTNELIGRPVEMLMPERFRSRHSGQRTGYHHTPRVRPMGAGFEFSGIRKDGSEFPIDISLSPLETDDGLLTTAAIRDVTERKRFERELQAANVELEKALAAKDRFLRSLSHELRTPLNAIIGFTGTMLMRLAGPLTNDQEKQLGTIKTSAKHLLSLINDLLDLVKIDSGKVEVKLEPVACGAVMEEVANTLRPLAEEKGLGFEICLPPGELIVSADRHILTQILTNLTNNAVKFTPSGSVRMEIAGTRSDGRNVIELQIVDTGAGIPENELARVFQAFTQLNPDTGGTGMGLYLSQKLAGLLGGEITCRSKYGLGSTFSLTLQES